MSEICIFVHTSLAIIVSLEHRSHSLGNTQSAVDLGCQTQPERKRIDNRVCLSLEHHVLKANFDVMKPWPGDIFQENAL